jgi:hypothetical protein
MAREIFEEIQVAREKYMPRLRLEPLKMTMENRTKAFRLKAEATG